MSKINIIPIFVPHMGCPNDCVFCNQRRITGQNEFKIEKFYSDLKYYLDIFKDSKKDIELAFYGGSFTAIDREIQFELLNEGKKLKENGSIDRIRLSTRPDCINEEILDYLKEYNVDIIELGVQSTNKEVLKLSKRGHKVEDVFLAVKLIRKYNFTLGLQQMVGLPGDNEGRSIETTLDLIDLKPDFVRIYPTLIIKNTELEDMYLENKYTPLSLEESVKIVSNLMLLYETEDIKIARVGLQAAENLSFDKDVVAGPLHDAFRELCESEKLYQIIKNSDFQCIDKDVFITSSPRNISLLVGQKGSNKERIKTLLKAKNIKFKNNSEMNNLVSIECGNLKKLIDIKEEFKNIVKGWDYVFKKHRNVWL